MIPAWLHPALRRFAASVPGLFVLGLAASYPSGGWAQADPPPPITLRVEQPAYTGMPVWLHVVTRDECFENADPTYPWFEYLWLRDDGAEVTHDGQPVARIPFKDFDPKHHIRIPDQVGCLTHIVAGPEHDHRLR